ncbi:MAG: SH3 domain-containing protein [Bacteroidales bacterium]|nr:SH3 domain-containing protein [Bacteroidales bacterium]
MSAPVRSMPDASGTELFTVHEGMKVRITDAVGDWSEAVFPNGSKGWVQTRQLTII